MEALIGRNTLTHIQPLSPKAKVALIGLVIFAHAFVLLSWMKGSAETQITNNEMTISFEMSAPVLSHAKPAVLPKEKITVQPKLVSDTPVTEPEAVKQEIAPSVASPISSSAQPQAVAITDPDYRAAYLNNPPPAYPMVAKRMGMQGRVLLQVEVLAAGMSGEVKIQQSSGYAVLDKAAVQAVKAWRFLPAMQAGQAVDKWFIIPVNFSLKDSTA